MKHEFPQLFHLFTSGKRVQLKHKLITAVAFSEGEATNVYKMSVCHLNPYVIKTFQLLRYVFINLFYMRFMET